MAVVKVIGALFKVPLQRCVGEYGMGLFNVAYHFYGPVFSLATAGFPVAVSRLVSESAALGRWQDVREIKRLAGPLFLGVGALGTVLVTLLAPAYCRGVGSPYALFPMLALAPAVLFACGGAVYRGYFAGLGDMAPTAVSEIIEAVIKLGLGLWCAQWVIERGWLEYSAQGTVLGLAPESPDGATFLILALAAAGAILGVTAGSLGAWGYLALRYKLCGHAPEKSAGNGPAAQNRGVLLKRLLAITAPVAVGSIALNAAGLIDATFLQNRLGSIMEKNPGRLLAAYEGMIPQVYLDNPESVPTFLYGCYTLAMTLYLLVPAVAQAIGVSALPAVTKAWAKGEARGLQDKMQAVLRLTALVSFPAGLGLTALAGPITRLLYGDGASTPLVAGVLGILGPASILAAMSTPLSSMLQGVGRAGLPVKLLGAAMVVKLVVNGTLCGVPEINLKGAGLGTLLCYLFLVVSQILALSRVTGVRLGAWQLMRGPLVCGLVCAGAAWAVQGCLDRLGCPNALGVGCGVLAGAAVYAFGALLLGAVDKNDLLMLPRGQKIVKTLEKRGWI